MHSTARRRWIAAGWAAAVVATILNGLVVGWFAVYFQLFGESADAEDHRVAAGGYGAAAGVLLLAVVGLLTHRLPRWLAGVALAAAAGLGVLARGALETARHAEPDPLPINTVWDGIGGVLWTPWSWALIGLALHGLYAVARGRRREGPASESPRSRDGHHPSRG